MHPLVTSCTPRTRQGHYGHYAYAAETSLERAGSHDELWKVPMENRPSAVLCPEGNRPAREAQGRAVGTHERKSKWVSIVATTGPRETSSCLIVDTSSSIK